MRIGFVSIWLNRGQAQVTRQIRGIFDAAGHATFVLARPTPAESVMPNLVEQRSVWAAEDVTIASRFQIPRREYLAWVEECALDAVFFDMNFQFPCVQAIRDLGVRTLGRFVWERFTEADVEPAKRAFDTIYSLTRAEQERYGSLGIESPYLHWGVHPEIATFPRTKRTDKTYFIFHGGMLGRRKPVAATIDAFKRVESSDIALIIKSQATHPAAEPISVGEDPRIVHLQDDMSFEDYQALYSSCHVSLCPARWEGLGVHLFESLGHEMPVISTDIPPINEVIRNGASGLLVRGHPNGRTMSGLQKYDPDVAELASAIETLSDPEVLQQYVVKTRAEADLWSWERTRADYLSLIN